MAKLFGTDRASIPALYRHVGSGIGDSSIGGSHNAMGFDEMCIACEPLAVALEKLGREPRWAWRDPENGRLCGGAASYRGACRFIWPRDRRMNAARAGFISPVPWAGPNAREPSQIRRQCQRTNGYIAFYASSLC
jgi:hypothetical protein